jgi:hypothetical protein
MGILHRRPGIRGQAAPSQTSPGQFCTTEGFYISGSFTTRGTSRGIGPIGKVCCHGLELGRLARDSWLPKCMVDNVLPGGPKILT